MSTRLFTAQEIASLVRRSPRPMVSKDLRIALVHSAKSGCTFAVKWFLKQLGHLEAATHFHHWIHNYRERVFEQSKTAKNDAIHILDETTRVLRVVREPYARCVSSFVHALKYGYEDARLGRFLRRPVDREKGLSFREFVDYLEAEDLRDCNIHHRVQAHDLELEGLVVPTRIVRLEDGKGVFRDIEEEWGLAAADLDSMRSSKHHTKRAEEAPFSGDVRLASHPQDKTPIPPARAFYDDSLRDRVQRLYREDFERYGYDPGAEI